MGLDNKPLLVPGHDHLMQAKSEIEKKLLVFKDKNFTFDEDSHTYRFNDIKYDSVTTFLKTFKVPFDREYWSRKKAEERGVDVSVVLNEWQEKANNATSLGTRVHKYIEDFWSGENPEFPSDEKLLERIQSFVDIYNRKLHVLLPLKSELKIFSRRWRLAGTIDQPFLFWSFQHERPFLIIGDWKTNGEFRDDSHPKGRYKKLLRPFSHLYENHHNEYSIQISLYRLILEEEANIETQDGFLCHIGPEGPAKIYRTKDLREPLKVFLDHNRTEFDIFNID
jgi:hypothetical protein